MGGILLLTTETLNRHPGTALCAGGCLQAKSFPGGKSFRFKRFDQNLRPVLEGCNLSE